MSLPDWKFIAMCQTVNYLASTGQYSQLRLLVNTCPPSQLFTLITNHRTQQGMTPLISAALSNEVEIVNYLVELAKEQFTTTQFDQFINDKDEWFHESAVSLTKNEEIVKIINDAIMFTQSISSHTIPPTV
jgi:hypothetical protein